MLIVAVGGKRDLSDCGQRRLPRRTVSAGPYVPVVCMMFAGRLDLLDRIKIAVRSTQNTDEVVAYARLVGRVLEACILGRATDAVAAIEMAMSAEEREAAEEVAGAMEDGNTLVPAMVYGKSALFLF